MCVILGKFPVFLLSRRKTAGCKYRWSQVQRKRCDVLLTQARTRRHTRAQVPLWLQNSLFQIFQSIILYFPDNMCFGVVSTKENKIIFLLEKYSLPFQIPVMSNFLIENLFDFQGDKYKQLSLSGCLATLYKKIYFCPFQSSLLGLSWMDQLPWNLAKILFFHIYKKKNKTVEQ